MGIGQLMTMPLFFASSAIYPIALMPHWLQVIAHGNPLTDEVDALRALLAAQGTSQLGVGLDIGMLAVAARLLSMIAVRLYPWLRLKSQAKPGL